MVTAILIPAIILYFYILSKRERKKFEENWEALENIKEEAIINGRVINKSEEKQRFYYHKFIYVTELKVKTPTTTVNAKCILPVKEDFTAPTINVGDEIKCIGEWKEDSFRFIHYNILP
ncbi:hypothetical protein [Fredinandcohnia sp. 179-A 10B2 NHS]|uniref:hypothetical protein n=1 Tax=Fredinandcohnia sp. 179-A 10B2 NHS TaxID=3235176 RepID=UPI0039A36970